VGQRRGERPSQTVIMSFSTSYICDKRHKRDGQKAKEGKSQSRMNIIMCGEKMKKRMKTKAHFHKVMATVKKEKRLV
jgi:hypothetical protein